jgi:Fusaric acid resistance protein-like
MPGLVDGARRLTDWLRRAFTLAPGAVPWREMVFVGSSVAIAELVCALAHHPIDAAFAAVTTYYVYQLDFGGPLRARGSTIVAGLVVIVLCGVLGHALSRNHVGQIATVFVLAAGAGAVYTTAPRVLQIVRYGIVAFLITSVFIQIGLNRLPSLGLGAAVPFGVAWAQERLLGADPQLRPGALALEARRLALSRPPADLRFTLCYGAVAALGLITGEALHLQRPYWVTVTTVFAMQPESAETVMRTFQRVGGTLIAVPVTIGVLNIGQAPWVLMLIIAVSAFLIPLAAARNYLLSSATTVVFVIGALGLVYLSQGGAVSLLWLRFYETSIGAALAIVGTAVSYGIPLRVRRSVATPGG